MATASLLAAAASGGHGHAAFYLLVALHAVSALTGFASIGFAGTYASHAGRLLAGGAGPQGEAGAPPPARPADMPDGPDEVEELLRYFAHPARLWWALLAVPVLGAAALSLQPHGHGFDQTWVLVALLVWLAATGLVARLVVPALGELGDLLRAAYPGGPDELGRPSSPSGRGGQGTPLDAGGARRAARAGLLASRSAAVCDCLFFVALALMVWQPNLAGERLGYGPPYHQDFYH